MKKKLIIVGLIIGVIVGLNHPTTIDIIKASVLYGALAAIAIIVANIANNWREICARAREARARAIVRRAWRKRGEKGGVDMDVIKVLLGTPTSGVFVKHLYRQNKENRTFVEKLDEYAVAIMGEKWHRTEPGNICKCMLEVVA